MKRRRSRWPEIPATRAWSKRPYFSGLEYNSKGQKTRVTDPLGRETVFTYAANETDLISVKQKNGSNYDLQHSWTYNSAHEPLTATDAAGQVTTYTYNASGKLETVISPARDGLSAADRTTTYSYVPSGTNGEGRIQTITPPLGGAVSFTYDVHGRVQTVADSESYTLTYAYDALDRPTRTTFPDGTYEETLYKHLDAESRRDRLGRWTHRTHDASRRLVSVHDSLGRVKTLQWCTCGSLDKLVDADGKATVWQRDLQARLTKEIWPNGAETTFAYENTTGRLKTVTDPKGQVATYTYFLDSALKQVTYTNAAIATPTVSFTYDPVYERMATMQDGTGVTTFAYNPIGATPAIGAGIPVSIDGPLSGDTISVGYDELGRVKQRTVSGLNATYVYDALGRTTTETNPLGSFQYTYSGSTHRQTGLTYPNGQTVSYGYQNNAGDRHLNEIVYRTSGASVISRYAYSYDLASNITNWTQERTGVAAKQYELQYDSGNQLVAGVLKTTGGTPTILKRYAYAYDKRGNRSGEQVDDLVTGATYDDLNRLVSTQPGGALRFQGTTDEAATVSVGGNPAIVSASNQFDARTAVVSGTSNVAVVATDPSGNARTNTYQVNQTGSSKSFTYDANGNMTADGTRTFEWDAANRLVAINEGTKRSEFTYDGLYRRTRIVEKDAGVVTDDKRLLWWGTELLEERDGTGTVLRRYWGGGMQQGGSSFFFMRDHLGSLRDMTDSTGAIRARYDYDPYGRRVKIDGDLETSLGYTGHFVHAPSGLNLAPYRAYSADLGRWISRDPIGMRGGMNAQAYVSGNPVRYADPLGLIKAPGNPNHNVNECDMVFIYHYFYGGGDDFTLPLAMASMYWNNPVVKMRVNQLTERLKAQADAKAKSKAEELCKECDKGIKSAFFDLDQVETTTNVEKSNPCLYSLGSSALYGDGSCALSVDCGARAYGFSCNLDFWINDWYRNPANRTTPWETGTPYRIKTKRGGSTSGGGSF